MKPQCQLVIKGTVTFTALFPPHKARSPFLGPPPVPGWIRHVASSLSGASSEASDQLHLLGSDMVITATLVTAHMPL